MKCQCSINLHTERFSKSLTIHSKNHEAENSSSSTAQFLTMVMGIMMSCCGHNRLRILALWSLLCVNHLNEAFRHSGICARVVARRRDLSPKFSTVVDDGLGDNIRGGPVPAATSTTFNSTASIAPYPSGGDGRSLRTPGLILAALEPGSPLHVQVGDLSLARKAWKKRRRNKSPLLAPCTLHAIDPKKLLQRNILYLIKKFGTPRLSIGELSRRYKSHLGSTNSLRTQAYRILEHHDCDALLDANASLLDLLRQLLPPGNAHGIHFTQNAASEEWSLQTDHWSHSKARRQASAAAMVQFQQRERSNYEMDATLGFQHTGWVRTKGKSGEYQLQPLSAALRIQNKDSLPLLVSGSSEENAIIPAFVWDFDPQGDAGAPLLILSLTPPPTQQQSKPYLQKRSLGQESVEDGQRPYRALETLQVGESLTGTVVQLVKGAALVDVNVGTSEEHVLLLGRLPFEEAVTIASKSETAEAAEGGKSSSTVVESEDLEYVGDSEDETSEDITHLFEFVDGVLQYTDPETGETQILPVDDDESDNRDGVQINVNENANSEFHRKDNACRRWLHVGDRIDVIVKSVSRRTAQFVLSMKRHSQHRQPIDESIPQKKAAIINKKLTRLQDQVGGLSRLESLTGSECDGVVKATSSLGYLYIQPHATPSLPVGIATYDPKDGDHVPLCEGDTVRIRIGGVDRKRGQLALEVLRKLAP